MEYMSDTVFFNGKRKRTVSSMEIFEKFTKSFKKKGPTKKWEYRIDEAEETMIIDFHDEKSESFAIAFNKKGEFDGFCKFYFPVDDETNEADYTVMYTMFDILYKAKSKFNRIEITDDYGVAANYWESKKFKFDLRELTEEELNRVKRWFDAGYTKHEDLLRAIMAEDMGMEYEEFVHYENPDIAHGSLKGRVHNLCATYVYEASAFRDEGRASDLLFEFQSDPNKYNFALWSFWGGISFIFFDGTGLDDAVTFEKHGCSLPMEAQIDLVYREKFAPAYVQNTDSFERCVLAYRYFLSVYAFTGFHYVGRKKITTVIDSILEEYGEELGTVYITIYTTMKKYGWKEEYQKNFRESIEKQYGSELLENYRKDFLPGYGRDERFSIESKYYADAGKRFVEGWRCL